MRLLRSSCRVDCGQGPRRSLLGGDASTRAQLAAGGAHCSCQLGQAIGRHLTGCSDRGRGPQRCRSERRRQDHDGLGFRHIGRRCLLRAACAEDPGGRLVHAREHRGGCRTSLSGREVDGDHCSQESNTRLGPCLGGGAAGNVIVLGALWTLARRGFRRAPTAGARVDRQANSSHRWYHRGGVAHGDLAGRRADRRGGTELCHLCCCTTDEGRSGRCFGSRFEALPCRGKLEKPLPRHWSGNIAGSGSDGRALGGGTTSRHTARSAATRVCSHDTLGRGEGVSSGRSPRHVSRGGSSLIVARALLEQRVGFEAWRALSAESDRHRREHHAAEELEPEQEHSELPRVWQVQLYIPECLRGALESEGLADALVHPLRQGGLPSGARLLRGGVCRPHGLAGQVATAEKVQGRRLARLDPGRPDH
mmetsp:Transcript_116717/g.371347  ORF Transcript_116717/g.371347 Transcript_116717/m.371347 type:complete len:421 (-) Transcript_116717:348-1610(-)